MQESQRAKGKGTGLAVEIVPFLSIQATKIKSLAQNPAGKDGFQAVGLIAEAKGFERLKACLSKLSSEGRAVKKTHVSKLVLLAIVNTVLP